MATSDRRTRLIEDRLRAAGVAFDHLEDVPPKVVRAVNRFSIGMRSILLPPKQIREALGKPLLGDLLVTRIGYNPHAQGSYIPRPDGSLDHIMIHCIEGEGWLNIGGREHVVEAGTMLCIPAGAPHWYGAGADNPWSAYWIHMTGRQAGEYFQFLGASVERPLLHLPDSREILAAFEETWALMKAVHTGENLIMASLSLARYLLAVRRAMSATKGRTRAVDQRIQETIAFVAANLAAEVSLAELAHLARLSVNRYAANFRRTTGCSPTEYFNRLRVQRACEMLRTTTISVREIARQMGYPDPYYFSRAFKQQVGVSPAAFRKG